MNAVGYWVYLALALASALVLVLAGASDASGTKQALVFVIMVYTSVRCWQYDYRDVLAMVRS